MLKTAAVAPSGDAPIWNDFLKQATGGDEELQIDLQRACGYLLTGGTREQVIFFLHGPSATVKTVFIETIAGVPGDIRRPTRDGVGGAGSIFWNYQA